MKTIIQNDLWSISSYIKNKKYNFDRSKILKHLPEKFIDEVLYNYNIFIAPGSIFGSQGSRFIRFSLCIDEKLIKTAIKRLTK